MVTNSRIQLYPFFRLVIFLVLGIVFGKLLYPLISPRIWGMSLVISLVVCVVLAFFHTSLDIRKAIFGTSFIFLSTFFLGGLVDSLQEHHSRVILQNISAYHEGVIYSMPVRHGKVYQLDIILSKGLLAGRKIKASILSDSSIDLQPGDGIHFFSSLEHPKNFNASFDYSSYLLLHGYIAETFITENNYGRTKVCLLSLSYLDRCQIKLLKLRAGLIQNHLSVQHQDRQVAAIIAAISLGDKSALDKDLKDVYSISGASHILALSGLHLGIIYALLTFLLGRKERWWKQIPILLILWSFVLLVGSSPSVVRSGVMISIFSILQMMNRSHLPLNAWSQALFLMLLFNPWNLFDVGMQMSFMAVLGILVYNVPLQHLLSFQNKILRFLWGTIAISLSAQIGVAPLIAFYFHRFSTLFVMTNFVVIPLTTVILYMVVISFMFVWWPFFHSLLLNIISNLGHLMNSFVEWEASLPVASIDHINLSVLQVFCIYVFIIAGSLFLSKILTLRKLIQLSNSYSSFEYDD